VCVRDFVFVGSSGLQCTNQRKITSVCVYVCVCVRACVRVCVLTWLVVTWMWCMVCHKSCHMYWERCSMWECSGPELQAGHWYPLAAKFDGWGWQGPSGTARLVQLTGTHRQPEGGCCDRIQAAVATAICPASGSRAVHVSLTASMPSSVRIVVAAPAAGAGGGCARLPPLFCVTLVHPDNSKHFIWEGTCRSPAAAQAAAPLLTPYMPAELDAANGHRCVSVC
jgi:hypothetical protein